MMVRACVTSTLACASLFFHRMTDNILPCVMMVQAYVSLSDFTVKNDSDSMYFKIEIQVHQYFLTLSEVICSKIKKKIVLLTQ